MQVDWGWHHSLVLDAEGGVWEAGCSRSSYDSPITFQHIPGLPLMTLVSAGNCHSAAIDTKGGLWVWTYTNEISWASSLPTRVEGLPSLLKVACGGSFLIAEAEEGLWILGSNTKLLHHTNSALQPTLIQVEGCSEGPLRCLAAFDNGVILIDSEGGVFTTLVPSLEGTRALVAGGFHSLAFSQEGGLLVLGNNCFGQLGLNHTTNQSTPTLCPVQAALPHPFISRKKSARFL